MNKKECQLVGMLKAERNYLSEIQKQYIAELPKLPEGYLCCVKNRGVYRYYQQLKKGRRHYLSKIEENVVTLLARKSFLKKSLPCLERNISLLDQIIKGYLPYDPDEICQSGRPAYLSELLPRSKVEVRTEDLIAWEDATFLSNPKYPQDLIHVSPRGEKVRSKSEVIIASLLYTHHIPYRYEAELILGTVAIYPDFTVCRPRDGKIVYWEHFGLVGKETYARNMENKMRLYKEHGIVPWNNLITTYDTPEGNFDVQTVFGVIQAFLL